MPTTPEITIVVGSLNARSSIHASLSSILEQCGEIRAEIIVADGSTDGTATIISAEFPQVRLLSGHERSLVPHLWGDAIREAATPLVAITTAHCIPEPGWIAGMIRAAREEPHRAGFGGPIEPPVAGGPKDWAMYFSRYASYMAPLPSGECREIPGDNAIYRKEDLERSWTERSNGFWETLFHENLRKAGRTIAMRSDVRVRFGTGNSFRQFVTARLKHGRHYGATRPGSSLWRIARIAAAPILAPFLLVRIGRAVLRRRPEFAARYAVSLPWLFIAVGAWSIGEITGYATRRP